MRERINGAFQFFGRICLSACRAGRVDGALGLMQFFVRRLSARRRDHGQQQRTQHAKHATAHHRD
jgi:hypothetical protein